MMTKEHIIETVGPIRFTISTGESGGSIGQIQVANAYPGITNGLIPSLTYPDVWSTAIEVADCLLTETYWPKNPSFSTPRSRRSTATARPTRSARRGSRSSFRPGFPRMAASADRRSRRRRRRIWHATTSRSRTPKAAARRRERPPGELWGRRGQDGFAKRPIDNVGVQYGLEALNLPVANPGKITLAQFLDLNLKIGGVDIDGLPTHSARAPTRTSRGSPTARATSTTPGPRAGRDPRSAIAVERRVHTPYHAYVTEARLAAIGHADNHAIWHAPGGR